MYMLDETLNLLDPRILENPYDFYTQLRETAPVWQVPNTRVFLVASWDRVVEAVDRIADFSSNLTGVLVRGDDGFPDVLEFPPEIIASAAISTADPPVHGLHRKLSQSTLSGPAVARLEAPIIAAVDALLAPLVKSGGGEVIGELARRLPALVLSWLLGFPQDDADKLMNWGEQGGVLLHGTHTAAEIGELLSDTVALSAYIDAQIDVARATGGEGFAGQMAKAIGEGLIDQTEARNILLVMIGAAVETTLSLIGNALWILARTPGMEERLRGEPSLIPAFIEETARIESPFKGHYRVVRRTSQLGGVDLEAGDRLLLLWASANRDGAMIKNPDTLDLDRPNPRRHMAFGHGLHFCLGAALARQEVRIVMERLFAHTDRIALGEGGATIVPSLFVRRLSKLELKFS